MREIKLRVHDEETGEILAYEHFNTRLNWGYFWLDAKELAKEGKEAICHAPPEYFKHCKPLGSVIRVLYTGLHDFNNREIYEGDILGGIWQGCYISWCDKCRSFELFFDTEQSPKYCNACNGDAHWAELVEDDGFLRVIGNIYENPELLQQQGVG
jgi:hypothetical protein